MVLRGAQVFFKSQKILTGARIHGQFNFVNEALYYNILGLTKIAMVLLQGCIARSSGRTTPSAKYACGLFGSS